LQAHMKNLRLCRRIFIRPVQPADFPHVILFATRLFCGEDRQRPADFHFEVENNSLQTFLRRR
ncbi:hypothetical protein, partial [Brenneria corticis]